MASLVGGATLVLGLPAVVTAREPVDRLGALRSLSEVPDGRRGSSARIPSGRPFVPGELIVAFRGDATQNARERALGQVSGAVTERLPLPGARLVELEPGVGGVGAAVRRLRGNQAVRYAQPNHRRTTQAIPNDPLFSSMWGLHNTGQTVEGEAGAADADIDVPEAWETQTGSSQTVVAIADTGVAYDHPDLDDNIWANPGEIVNGVDDDGNGKVDDVRGWDFVTDGADPYDGDGHGTHVAGTVGAVGDNGSGTTGVAWDVSLMPVRVLDATGSGTDADIAAGFDYAAKEGADVVNASLGGPGASPVIDAAISGNPGTLFVVAAGNDGEDNDATPQAPCNSTAPNLICVAATDQHDDLADFSNFGATSVDLAAPGVSVNSTMVTFQLAVLIDEGFEAGNLSGWSTGGVNNSWAVTGENPASGSWGLSDSPFSNYLANTDSFVRSPANSSVRRDLCQLEYELEIDTEEGFDGLLTEASSNGSDWTVVSAWTGTGAEYVIDDVSAFDRSPSLHVRFALVSDNIIQADGAYVDDVFLSCFEPDSLTFDFLDGTSMATPHVAGVAALILSERPGLAATEARSVILGSVDPKPSLAGNVATGGRLNAAAALADAPPNTTITGGPQGPTADSTPTFTFTSDPPGAAFECRIDSGGFGPCSGASSHTTGGLVEGPHTFRVRAVDGITPDPSPAQRSFTVDTTGPVTTITKGPPKRVVTRRRKVRAKFGFTANEQSESECRLDRRPWRPCSSPKRYRVGKGRHKFRVRGTDALDNRGPAARHKWRVVRRR